MEIQEGLYAFIYDNGNNFAKGVACVGYLPGKYLGVLHGEENLEDVFLTTFRKKWRSDYYNVTLLLIYKQDDYDEDTGKETSEFYIYPYHWDWDGKEPDKYCSGYGSKLTATRLLSLKLLLKDSLTISPGRQKPLKLAIEIANDIRDVGGMNFNNVPNVFQEHHDKANADFMSALSELTGAVESASAAYPNHVQALGFCPKVLYLQVWYDFPTPSSDVPCPNESFFKMFHFSFR